MKEKAFSKYVIDKNIELNLSTREHRELISAIGKALSSPVRIDILNLVKTKPISIQEISRILHIPLSSTAMHIKCLEEAKLVITENQPGIHGTMRVCMCGFISVHIDANAASDVSQESVVISDMPIGNYFSFDVAPTCGLADENGIIDGYDTPVSFYSPNRQRAQLIWFKSGFIEYRFPNNVNPLIDPSELSFSLEICSEAPGYCESWPSDISFFVNGIGLGTYTSPGDFGARRGILTPETWPMGRTQYGLLTTISLRSDGTYINEILVNRNVTTHNIRLHDSTCIAFKIAIEDNAGNVGGINIFGEKYGDFPQGIRLRIRY